jgi:hypothetical protein
MSCTGKLCHTSDPHCIYPECQAVSSLKSDVLVYGAAVLAGLVLALAMIGVFSIVA